MAFGVPPSFDGIIDESDYSRGHDNTVLVRVELEPDWRALTQPRQAGLRRCPHP